MPAAANDLGCCSRRSALAHGQLASANRGKSGSSRDSPAFREAGDDRTLTIRRASSSTSPPSEHRSVPGPRRVRSADRRVPTRAAASSSATCSQRSSTTTEIAGPRPPRDQPLDLAGLDDRRGEKNVGNARLDHHLRLRELGAADPAAPARVASGDDRTLVRLRMRPVCNTRRAEVVLPAPEIRLERGCVDQERRRLDLVFSTTDERCPLARVRSPARPR